ncbi:MULTISPECIES: hypothetical protein [unclassified Kitasatospora]|uniref:hypothetical protein n=1 Tax=unclassified Kitasatospora TaxID=2633591 RepID=UPI00070CD5CC|nr:MULTISPECIES: hypothetical protein [unclassified Kitasatospora]KQV20819.1 hypothetical protein ASC99_20125 [Kitasatospora sp. Root107]KRB60525.1 hypothetical protein ASE03_13055 [Kitasatospora sp. Root187]
MSTAVNSVRSNGPQLLDARWRTRSVQPMPRRSPGPAQGAAVAGAERVIDGLYALAPSDFTRVRDDAAAEARRAGGVAARIAMANYFLQGGPQ